ncbi:Protein N-acetyltransferase, RimJ/RimL family [Aquimarina amphilecti]|uniref:Protein N-acetyltransferase, RimJ/RimL family n=1 Tax=Aquimarina amphilecti TaxID=1038014 RepID=A0A1H7VH85_AQUAM|nr:GNAT family protein [Aquimarina amphilecti]SEM08249.1 Protein N-acetyltransferase, RimJ/RimL family [Aquimarina amphilecti]
MENQKIEIRTLKLSDKLQLAKLANNKDIWNNLRDYIPHPYSENDAETFINFTQEQNPQQSFAIEFKNQLCGVISLIIQNDVYRKNAEIGYWIGQPYWGNGIATKAVKLITLYGFKELDLTRIYAGVFENNIASMRILEKNGYTKEAVFQKAIIKNGKTLDEHRYFILTEDQE